MTDSKTLDEGAFISFEGIDGCGKTTQAMDLAETLEMDNYDVVYVREPGRTATGEKIRDLLLDKENTDIVDECELLLYEASRAQLVKEVIQPALDRHAVVICDRFYDSTYAYQAGARGLDADLVKRANELGSCGLAPDITILLDVDPELAHKRSKFERRGQEDRIEAEGLKFQESVRQGYLDLAKQESDRIHVIDGSGFVGEVTNTIQETIVKQFPMFASAFMVSAGFQVVDQLPRAEETDE